MEFGHSINYELHANIVNNKPNVNLYIIYDFYQQKCNHFNLFLFICL